MKPATKQNLDYYMKANLPNQVERSTSRSYGISKIERNKKKEKKRNNDDQRRAVRRLSRPSSIVKPDCYRHDIIKPRQQI